MGERFFMRGKHAARCLCRMGASAFFIIHEARQGAQHAVYSLGFVLPEGLSGRRRTSNFAV